MVIKKNLNRYIKSRLRGSQKKMDSAIFIFLNLKKNSPSLSKFGPFDSGWADWSKF